MTKPRLDLPCKILVLPDAQVKPDEDLSFLHCQGMYIVAKKPDIVVCMGDFADMQSLSSYDKGRRSYEGRRYKNDIEAAKTGMKILLDPIKKYNEKQLRDKKAIYKPKLVLTLGNHEHRIERATQVEPMLHGTIGIKDLEYESFGWEVHPYQEVVVIKGIAFSHNFPVKNSPSIIATTTNLMNKKHMSCVAGHQQGLQISTSTRGDGKLMTCIIAGSSYEHNEDYLGPQGNAHWRGIIMLHNCSDGEFDPVMIPTSYLRKRYNPKGLVFNIAPE